MFSQWKLLPQTHCLYIPMLLPESHPILCSSSCTRIERDQDPIRILRGWWLEQSPQCILLVHTSARYLLSAVDLSHDPLKSVHKSSPTAWLQTPASSLQVQTLRGNNGGLRQQVPDSQREHLNCVPFLAPSLGPHSAVVGIGDDGIFSFSNHLCNN